MPIVVGVPRSGTTLLRLMLDAHPDLAIPPETGFLVPLAGPEPPRDASAFVGLVSNYPPDLPSWPDFGVDAGALLETVERLRPFDPAEAVRCFYRAYAERQGKPRWGDKSPGYHAAMPQIRTLLPEARFVHVVRDPRDVVVSWRRQWFAPSRDAGVLAAEWRRAVEGARAAGVAGVPVLEVRFEDLVRDPAGALGRVCGHVGLDLRPSMLEHQERAAGRLAEHQGRRRGDGSVFLTREARLAQQASSAGPPDLRKVGTWRTELLPEEAGAVLDETRALLADLGYEEA